jgi:hypothetical protein
MKGKDENWPPDCPIDFSECPSQSAIHREDIMKRALFLLIAFALLIAGSRPARAQGNLNILKQKARQVQNENNQQQGVAPPPQPQPAQPPPPQGPSASQQQLIDQLKTDLGVFKAGAAVLDPQKEQLTKDIAALAKGAIKPSQESASKLAADLSTALTGKNIFGPALPDLAKNINVVVNSGPFTMALAQNYVTGSMNILKNGGAGDADAKSVADDLKAIADELHKKN